MSRARSPRLEVRSIRACDSAFECLLVRDPQSATPSHRSFGSASSALPSHPTLLYPAPTGGLSGRGGTGRRARFRSWYRKMWGFESLRPHQSPPHQGRTPARRQSFYIMQTVETLNQGLKRAYRITIPKKEIDARVDGELRKVAPQIRMPGFRPGKVPPNLVRKMHGPAIEQEALQSAVQEGVQQLLAEQKLRPAMQPQVELEEGGPGKDAIVKVELETLPEVPAPKIDELKLERLLVEPSDEEIDASVARLAEGQKSFEPAPADRAAQTGDLLVIDYEGKVDGEPFEGGKGESMRIELGSGRLIPGFEDQLVGARANEQRIVTVTFPEEYPVAYLKGREAVFEVTVGEVQTARETRIDDSFAQSMGLEGLAQLRELMKGQVEQELGGLTRTHMKRKLLDQLAEAHDFEVPPSMVEAEFRQIWEQLEHEASHEEDPAAAMAEMESERDDYRSIAERRVRLGLLLSEIGQR